MKFYLLPVFLCLQVPLLCQAPILTLDYYYQDGKYDYNFYEVDSSILQLTGANVIWDFSRAALRSNDGYTFTYSVASNGEKNAATGMYENVFKTIEKTPWIGDDNYVLLCVDSLISLQAKGYSQCISEELRGINTLAPSTVFPPSLSFLDSFSETVYVQVSYPTKATLPRPNTFTYTGYGNFIHPNGDTICEVIQLKRIAPNDQGHLIETVTWYSKEAKSPLAILTNNLDEPTTKNQVEIRAIDFFAVTSAKLEADTLKVAHTTNACEFYLDFFPFTSCAIPDYDKVFIDYNNNGGIEDTSYLNQPTAHKKPFKIGTHRLIFQQASSQLLIEKILVIEDKQSPIFTFPCLDGWLYKYFSPDSFFTTITPNDLLFWGIWDNHCEGTLTYRMWFEGMDELGIPRPDTLSIPQILSELPTSYQIDCFEEAEKSITGILYAFDLAGNWTKAYIYLHLFSNNCPPPCPAEITTNLSIKDINGNFLNEVIADDYGKEMDKQGDLYLYQICATDSTNARLDFYKTNSVLENVSTFDLLLIQQHILGKKPFTTFYQFATTFDLLTIKRIILGLNPSFIGNRSWVFFEQEAGLLDKHPNIEVLPLHLLEEKRFDIVDTTYQFLGIKLGDVSQ